jgi:hypothetical protein
LKQNHYFQRNAQEETLFNKDYWCWLLLFEVDIHFAPFGGETKLNMNKDNSEKEIISLYGYLERKNTLTKKSNE